MSNLTRVLVARFHELFGGLFGQRATILSTSSPKVQRSAMRTGGLILCGGLLIPTLPLPAQPPASLTSEQSIQQLARQHQRLGKQLSRVHAVGRLRVSVELSDRPVAVIVQDADLQMVCQPGGFRIDIANHRRLQPGAQPGSWQRSPILLHSLILDSDRLISYEIRDPRGDIGATGTEPRQKATVRSGRTRGDIYFPFAQESVLRSAGFSLPHPIELWRDAIDAGQLDPEKMRIVPLPGNGWLSIEDHGNFLSHAWVQNDPELRLRRVAKYRPGENHPFREYLLDWEQAEGQSYVQRFVRRQFSPRFRQAPEVPLVTGERLEIHFETFNPNVTLGPEAFAIDKLPLQVGSQFRDHRVPVDGQPKKLWWNGQSLSEIPPQQGEQRHTQPAP